MRFFFTWTVNKCCIKGVLIRSFSGPCFPAFGLNTERYAVSLRIQSVCEKIQARKTPNADTFYAVFFAGLCRIIKRLSLTCQR